MPGARPRGSCGWRAGGSNPCPEASASAGMAAACWCRCAARGCSSSRPDRRPLSRPSHRAGRPPTGCSPAAGWPTAAGRSPRCSGGCCWCCRTAGSSRSSTPRWGSPTTWSAAQSWIARERSGWPSTRGWPRWRSPPRSRSSTTDRDSRATSTSSRAIATASGPAPRRACSPPAPAWPPRAPGTGTSRSACTRCRGCRPESGAWPPRTRTCWWARPSASTCCATAARRGRSPARRRTPSMPSNARGPSPRGCGSAWTRDSRPCDGIAARPRAGASKA